MPWAVRILPILLFLVFTLFFNTNLVTVRVSELNYLLENASVARDVLNDSEILGRFELVRRRLDQGESRLENYQLEARIQALTAPRGPSSRGALSVIGPLVPPLRGFLNALRAVLGKDAIHPEKEDGTLRALEVAYLRERGRSYGPALREYLRILPDLSAGSDLRATTLLHVAFCDSMLNSVGSARAVLADIISENPGKEQSAIAWNLLGFLDLLEKRRSVPLPGNPTDLDRAKRAYLLVDYSASISLLTGFILANGDDPRLAEAFYFRGRSHEEMGELPPAIADYRSVVSRSSTGNWARDARRRLILLGIIYGQGEQVARDAMGGALHSETAFLRAITPFARIVDPRALVGWPAVSAGVPRSKAAAAEIPQETSPDPVPPSAPDEMPTETVEIASVPTPLPAPEMPISPEQEAEKAHPDVTPGAVPEALPEALPEARASVFDPSGDLFLPPLRMAQSPEPSGVAVLASTIPGGSIAAVKAKRLVLERQYQEEIRLRKAYNAGSWVSLGAGVASTGTMGYFLYQAFASYAQYKAATSAGQAKTMREQTQFNSTAALTAGVAGGLALAAALTLQLIAPPAARTEDRIRVLDEAISLLGQASR
jgi:hypothetical protein